MMRGLVGRLTVTTGIVTSGIVAIVALAIGGLVYVQTERAIAGELSRSAAAIIRDELTSSSGVIGLQKSDGGKSLADLLRNLDVSLYVADASGSGIASYGIYRTVDAADIDILVGDLRSRPISGSRYADKQVSGVGRVDTYTVPLNEGKRTVGVLQLTRINNIWPIIGTSLLVSLLFMIPVVWGLTLVVSRWGTKRTLAPLSALVSSVSALDVDHLPEGLEAPNAMDEDVRVLYGTLQALIRRIRGTIRRQREISENLSHEFKTPLTRVVSRLGVISDGLPEAARASLDDAVRELVDLGEQVDGLLDVAVNGTNVGSGSVFRFRPFITRLVEHLNDRTHTIRIDVPEELEIRMPPGHARLVCRNLLDNAVKYAPSGSEIRILATRTDAVWTFSVTNAVSADTRVEGDIFARKHRGSTPSVSGYGLGLAIVKDVARQLGLQVAYAVEAGRVCISVSGKI